MAGDQWTSTMTVYQWRDEWNKGINYRIRLSNGGAGYHREGGPACIVSHSGTEFWYRNGVIHRLDGPAVITASGVEHWYIFGYKLDGIEEFKRYMERHQPLVWTELEASHG